MKRDGRRNRISAKQLLLLVAAPAVALSMIWLYPAIASSVVRPWGLLAGAALYWVPACAGLSLITLGWSDLRLLYSSPPRPRDPLDWFSYALVWLSPLVVFFVVFLPLLGSAGLLPLTAAAVTAVVNGTAEEIFWRGSFRRRCSRSLLLALWYPLVFFTLWHVGVDLAMTGGGRLPIMLSTAFFAGLAWGWSTWRTGRILHVTAAHVLTNFFTFVALFVRLAG
jgi:membrane protease YdiL (CAAX protease family)